MCDNAPNQWMNALNKCSPAGCSYVNRITETFKRVEVFIFTVFYYNKVFRLIQ